jgi:hypothetical protein
LSGLSLGNREVLTYEQHMLETKMGYTEVYHNLTAREWVDNEGDLRA